MTWVIRVVTPKKPARFVLVKPECKVYYNGRYYDPTEITVKKGDTIVVIAVVENVGDEGGTCELAILANGRPVRTDRFYIAGHKKARRTFSLKINESVNIDIAVKKAGEREWSDTYG